MPAAPQKIGHPSRKLDNAQPSDIDRIVDIDRLRFTTAWSKDYYLSELGRATSILQVCRCHAVAVAYLNAWICHDEVQILRVATHPEHDRRGHAAALMEVLVSACRTAGLSCVFLEVRPSNDPALGLYIARGFAEVARRPAYYADGEDALVLRLDLGPST